MKARSNRWPRLHVRIRFGRRGGLTLPLLSVCTLSLVVAGLAVLLSGEDAGSGKPAEPVELEPAPVAELVAPPEPGPALPRKAPARPPVEAPQPVWPAESPPATEPPVVPEPLAQAEPIATPSASNVLERCLEVESLAEDGSSEVARITAQVLLAEHVKHNTLVKALVENGAEPLRAHLLALRMLQVAGEEERALATARILKREFLDLSEVVVAIREWKVLRPRISSVEVSVESGDKLFVTGTLHNPDVTSIRGVRVHAEALDAEGRVIGVAETRAKPKRLGPESEGTFKVRIRGIDDPAAVARTRATIVAYEFEVTEKS